MAPKLLSPSGIAERIAQTTGINVDDVKKVLQSQVELAYSQSDIGFMVPGIGTLRKIDTPERTGTNPFTGEKAVFPAKRKLQFRVSRLASSVAFDPSRRVPNLFSPDILSMFAFSTQATDCSGDVKLTGDLGDSFTRTTDGNTVNVRFYRLPDLRLTTGRIVAADGLTGSGDSFQRRVAPGSYGTLLAIAQLATEELIALAAVRFSTNPIVKWEIAKFDRDQTSETPRRNFDIYGVDSACGSFSDEAVQELVDQAMELDIGFHEMVAAELTGDWVHIESPNGSKVIFSSGRSDGSYKSYFGLDIHGEAVALATDFQVVNWAGTAAT